MPIMGQARAPTRIKPPPPTRLLAARFKRNTALLRFLSPIALFPQIQMLR